MKERRRPDTVLRYDPEALKKNIGIIDQSIARTQEAIDKAKIHIEAAKRSIARSEKDIEIFYAEMGKLENDKAELQKLIAQLEGG
jgi:chromosome segregation ATPase